MATDLLSDYLEVIPEASPGDMGQVRLKIPIADWPADLQERWKEELFFLFPAENKVARVDAKDCLSLCHEVEGCPRKRNEAEEQRHCVHYNQGICIAASVVANDFEPLSFGTIGAFNGISKQRVQQIYGVAQRKVIRAAARDPILREYYTSLGLKPENMPDPQKIADNIKELLAKKQ